MWHRCALCYFHYVHCGCRVNPSMHGKQLPSASHFGVPKISPGLSPWSSLPVTLGTQIWAALWPYPWGRLVMPHPTIGCKVAIQKFSDFYFLWSGHCWIQGLFRVFFFSVYHLPLDLWKSQVYLTIPLDWVSLIRSQAKVSSGTWGPDNPFSRLFNFPSGSMFPLKIHKEQLTNISRYNC